MKILNLYAGIGGNRKLWGYNYLLSSGEYEEKMAEIDKYKVPDSFSIRDVVKKMDEGSEAFCVCVDAKDQVIGVITDGDFRQFESDGCDRT